jgi:hypothetical protein
MVVLPQGRNRRAFPRAKCSIPVTYGEDPATEGLAVDLTSEGISILAEEALPVGTLVRLQLKVNGETVPAKAVVRYHHADLMGMKFVQISMADRVKLDRAVYG